MMNRPRVKKIRRPYSYKLYVNKDNLQFWDIVKKIRDAGMLPSDYFCKAVISKYKKDLRILQSLIDKQHKAQTTKEKQEYDNQIIEFTKQTKPSNKKSYEQTLEDIKAYCPPSYHLIDQDQDQDRKTIAGISEKEREITEDEKEARETSEKIASGEWIVVTDEELANMNDNNDEEFEIE